MSKSQRLALKDVQSLLRLQAEVLERRSDHSACMTYALQEVRRLLPTRLVIYLAMDGFAPREQPTPFASIIDGDIDTELQDMLAAWMDRPDKAETQPFMKALMCQPDTCFTHRRIELVEDSEWFSSEIMQQYFRQFGIDDNLCTIWRCHGSMRIYGIGLHRAVDEPAFTQREQAMLHLLQQALIPLYTQWDRQRRLTEALTPRLREALRYLLDDCSERHIARLMNISPHTVHDYAKWIYRHFRVSSRRELQSKWWNR